MRRERHTINAERIALGLVAVALAALGVLWRIDRTRTWEIPRWDDARLVHLGGGGAGDLGPAGANEEAATPAAAASAGVHADARGGPPRETWAFAVNPLCESCRASLARGLALRRRTRAPVRLAALLVDTRRRPDSVTPAALGVDELRWDSTGVWRHHWGHRVYGEVLCFDRAGRCVRTLAPISDSLAARHALRIADALSAEGGS